MTKLGIVTGMAFEADILHAAADRLAEAQRPIIVCHGFGRSASRRAALEAVSLGAEALLSFGSPARAAVRTSLSKPAM